jgi:hypothetical protein
MELQIGHIYLINGGDYLKLANIPKSKELNIECRTPGGSRYYVAEEDMIREATEEDIKIRKEALIARNMHKEAELLQTLWDGREVS